jgi:hypothetical protein
MFSFGKKNSLIKRFYFIFVIGVILALIAPLSGCSNADKIADIKANPSQYEGKTVSIKGYVGNTFWVALASRGAYEVDDGSASIWVVTSQQPPEKGAQVSVRGTVSPAFQLGDRTLGTVVNETKRN